MEKVCLSVSDQNVFWIYNSTHSLPRSTTNATITQRITWNLTDDPYSPCIKLAPFTHVFLTITNYPSDGGSIFLDTSASCSNDDSQIQRQTLPFNTSINFRLTGNTDDPVNNIAFRLPLSSPSALLRLHTIGIELDADMELRSLSLVSAREENSDLCSSPPASALSVPAILAISFACTIVVMGSLLMYRRLVQRRTSIRLKSIRSQIPENPDKQSAPNSKASSNSYDIPSNLPSKLDSEDPKLQRWLNNRPSVNLTADEISRQISEHYRMARVMAGQDDTTSDIKDQFKAAGEATSESKTMPNAESESDAIFMPGYLEIDLNRRVKYDTSWKREGGSGSLYKGAFKSTSKSIGVIDVAIKEYKDGQGGDFECSFRFEVALMAGLPACPNLIQLLGYSTKPVKSIVMEFIEFCLSDVIRSNMRIKMSPMRVGRIALDISNGMKELHRYGILHLDLKPLNILVDKGQSVWRCVICDFGSSNVIGKERSLASGLGRPNRIALTYPYTAPEYFVKLRGGAVSPTRLTDDRDKKVDVYAFSMTLFEVITQTRPWQSLDPEAIIDRVVAGQRPNHGEETFSGYTELTEIMKECWSQDPMQRPDFASIHDKIKEILEQRSAPSSPI